MTVTQQSPPNAPPTPAPSSGGPYREDQGRHVRMAAFWLAVFFVLFGCRFLHGILVGWESMRTALGGVRIPVVGIDLTPAFLLTGGLFAIGTFFVSRWQQRPKVADLLIDTEAELRKVNWPKGTEVWNASVVVIVFVVLLGGFLALTDAVLFRLMRYLILGIK
jgi:preprotein translocase SecE subunit